ncbi:unnamed protein product, partial [Gulo gulo]
GRLLGHGIWETNVWPRSLTEDYTILCGVAGLQAFREGFSKQEGRAVGNQEVLALWKR